MYRLIIALLILLTSIESVLSQETFHPNGVADQTEFTHAFVNAKIYVDYKTVINRGTLIIKDKVIIAVGTDVSIPKGAVVHDVEDKVIYPSFIDIYSNYGMPEVKEEEGGYYQFEKTDKGAGGWNMSIRAEINAVDLFEIDDDSAKAYRDNGFGAVLTSQNDGVVRGTSVLVDLNNKHEHHSIIKQRAAMGFSFKPGSSPQDYPSTQLGAIALLKQTYHDASWYRNAKAKDNKNFNATFEAFNEFRNLPKIFEVGDYIEELRADNIADEFGVQYIIKGIGDEYKRIDEMKKAEATFILPLNFPKVFDVKDPYYARMLALEDMKHWEMAPANPAILEQAQIDFVFTSDGLKKRKDFISNISRAIQYGLTEETALKAITAGPAELLKVSDKVGALKKGMRANFIISKGNLFDKDNVIYENWVGGSRHIIKPIKVHDARGEYSFLIGARTYELTVKGKINKPKGELSINDSTEINVNLGVEGHNVTMDFEMGDKEYYRLAGSIDFKARSWAGTGKNISGDQLTWTVAYSKPVKEKNKKEDTTEVVKPTIGDVWFPNKAYGFKELPARRTTIIKNATVWTNEEVGIMQNTDVLLRDGKIAAIGKDLKAEGAEIINATGKHLTVGIIDEHVHFALRGGINENATSCSAE
ncbi:MAG: amidohydrolase family protein, partial [Bacteroidetes bacterium]|nr:amidohydrolase family protein [Bacteroidota bacterium]